MKKSTFDYQPSLVHFEGEQAQVNFDIEEVEVKATTLSDEEQEEQARTAWQAYSVRLTHPLTRSRIIDAIVTAAYPQDVMQAVVNNHLIDPDDEEHEAEFRAMQEWRKKAKEVAGQVMKSPILP